MCQRLARLSGYVLELSSADMNMMQHQLKRSGKVHAANAGADEQAAVNLVCLQREILLHF